MKEQFYGKSATFLRTKLPQTSGDDFLHVNTHSEKDCPLEAKVGYYDCCIKSVGQLFGKSATFLGTKLPQTSGDDFLHVNTHSEKDCPLEAKVGYYD